MSSTYQDVLILECVDYGSFPSLPSSDVKVWDVLTELVEICTAPCPPNPFAVDLDYFKSLQLPERALASAAMIAFLQKLIASGPHHYDRRSKEYLYNYKQNVLVIRAHPYQYPTSPYQCVCTVL